MTAPRQESRWETVGACVLILAALAVALFA